MPHFSDFLGLAVTFAAVFAFMIEPMLATANKTDHEKPSIPFEQAANTAEYEVVFLFSLFGLLVACALLPHMASGAALGRMLVG